MDINKNSIDKLMFHSIIKDEDIQEMIKMKIREDILKKYSFPKKPSSDGFYHIYLKDVTGKRKAVKSKTLEGLKEKVYEYETGMRTKPTQKTFKECFAISQQEKTRFVKSQEKILSVNNTLSRNSSEYRRFFEGSELENRPIDEITKKDLENFVEQTLTKFDLHPKGLASMRSILNSVFRLAYQESWINDNIYERIDFKKYSDMLSSPVPTENRCYTDDELQRIMRQIKRTLEKKPDYITAYALEMQIICGLRRGEIPPLRWSDIYEHYVLICREQLTVKKTENTPEHFELVNHTKTYKNRKYPITEELGAFLERLKKVHQKYYPDSEFLFPAKTDNGCITNNCTYNYFRRVCRKENIKISKEVIKGTHAFRRTRITETINKSGGNIVLASELFGNSPEVARKYYYTGIDMEQARKILNT